jgi:hypothetical protein
LRPRTNRRKRLWRLLIASIIIAVIAFAALHTFLSNAVASALKRSLGTLSLQSVTYPAINLSSPEPFVQVNITFTLTNPTVYPVTIEAISLAFSIDQQDIGGLNVPLVEDVQAGESTVFFFVQTVDDDNVLQSLMNPTFSLSGEGLATGSAHFLYFQTSTTRTLAFSKTVPGVLEAKS